MAVFDLFKRFANQTTAPGERRVDERVRATQGARVLVVDDSATIRAVLGKMLVQDGYEVLNAADGETAIEVAGTQLPDLIFLDLVLPGMSGFAVLRAMRHEAGTQTTPIVMMSGNQQATEQFYVQRFGADGFVKKPFGRAEVFHAIRALVTAGRLPARAAAPAPTTDIPADISPEEWAAIPEIAMPDAEHLVPGFVPPASNPPSPAAVSVHAGPAAVPDAGARRVPSAADPSRRSVRGTVITGAATSMAISPTVVAAARATSAPPVVLRVDGAHAAEVAAPALSGRRSSGDGNG